MSSIELGTLVFVYQHAECRGRCLGLDEVAEIKVSDDGCVLYRMKRENEHWHESSRLMPAQRPPVGTATQFNIGEHVRCYGTYRRYVHTATIEHIVWFEGKPDYYVIPTQTPWYPYNDDSLSLADDSVNLSEFPEIENMMF